MIAWIEQNSNNPLTGKTEQFESYSYDATGLFANTFYTITGAITNATESNWSGTTYKQTVENDGSNQANETISNATFQKQTSTVESYESWYETYSYAGTTLYNEDFDPPPAWTYSTSINSENSTLTVVEFVQTTTNTVSSYVLGFTSSAATRYAVTILEETQLGKSPFATIYQAEPNEILYWLTQTTSVTEYLAATDCADSGSRVTLYPSLTTGNIIVTGGRNETTATLSQQAITSSIVWYGSTTTNSQRTVLQNAEYLPNITASENYAKITTTSNVTTETIFSAETFTVGFIPLADHKISATTNEIISWRTKRKTFERQIAEQSFQTTTTEMVSESRTISTTAHVDFTYTTSDVVGLDDGAAQASFSTIYQARGNMAAFGTSLITEKAAPIERQAMSTTGVVLESEKGGWITCNIPSLWLFDGTSSVATCYDGEFVGGVSLMPATNSRFTINGKSITFTKSINDSTTTQSSVAGVFGETLTTTINASGRPRHAGAFEVGDGGTYIDTPGFGVYKDQIAGVTTSFDGEITVLTESDATPLKSWSPIRHVGPAVVATTSAAPVIWAVEKNNAVEFYNSMLASQI